MIVRISGEGQYDVPQDAVDGLNKLDDAVELVQPVDCLLYTSPSPRD